MPSADDGGARGVSARVSRVARNETGQFSDEVGTVPRGAGPERERQYEHIEDSAEKRKAQLEKALN
jgi:hypothetical protein